MGADVSMLVDRRVQAPSGLGPVSVIGWPGNRGTDAIVAAWRRLGLDARLVSPPEALTAQPEDAVLLVRLDVLRTLDGVEPGLEHVCELERRGLFVLNRAEALLGAHDKLQTAALLAEADVPQPETGHVDDPWAPLPVPAPLVVKPRFGSWGRDVFLCNTAAEARLCLLDVADRSWFRRHGAIVQELVPFGASDLRVVVAGDRVVGAALRSAAPGEWRTNVSLGGTLEPAVPPAVARRVALAAVRALGADLAGVDLVRRGDEWVVLEVNGAVEFDDRYALPGRNVFADAARALGLCPSPHEGSVR